MKKKEIGSSTALDVYRPKIARATFLGSGVHRGAVGRENKDKWRVAGRRRGEWQAEHQV